MTYRYLAPLVLCVLIASVGPSNADAQLRRGRAVQGTIAPWPPIAVGFHAGYDEASRGELIGVHAHIPVLRNGRLALSPSYDLTFLNGARDKQYGIDAVFMTAGRAGGLYLGGGVGYRDTVIDATPGDPSSVFFGYSIVAGFRSDVTGSFATRFQLRWIFLQDTQADFSPRPLTLGISFPLWGRRAQGS